MCYRWPQPADRRLRKLRQRDSADGVNTYDPTVTGHVPFIDFGGGSNQTTVGESQYHGLQTKVEEQFANGMTFLFAYTFSKALSDAGDLLNGGSNGGLPCPQVPVSVPSSIGVWLTQHSTGLHFSGGYELAVRQRQTLP